MWKKLKIKEKWGYGTKTVMILKEKHYIGAILGTFNLEEYVNTLHPCLIFN